jgi:hypothetical protein
MKINLKFLLLFVLNFLVTQNIFALKITEIMFNPTGSDTNREWVEVFNDTSSVINFAGYKFNEANVDHRIAEVGSSSSGWESSAIFPASLCAKTRVGFSPGAKNR